jgi:hypothetical protein
MKEKSVSQINEASSRQQLQCDLINKDLQEHF